MPPTRQVITFAMLILVSGILSASVSAQKLLGAFANLQLQIDTQIESPAVNNSIQTLDEQPPGNTIHIQLFVPEGAGKQTVGYNIELDLAGLAFADHIGDISGTAWTGTPLSLTVGKPILTALLISGPTVPSDGYLGQISLQVTQSLTSGTLLAIKSASMADFSAENDPLNVSSATVSFTSGTPAIQGDFDLDGDVDFVDFLTFSKNFGKSGPAPTSGPVATTTVVVHDTITITQTDTVAVGDVSARILGF